MSAEGVKMPFLVKAIQDFSGAEINFKKNQILTVMSTNDEEFLYYGNYKGKQGTINGWFPSFFVQRIDNTTVNQTMEAKPEKKKEEVTESEEAKKDAILNRRAQRKQRVAKLQQQSLNSAVVAQKRDKLNLPGTSRFRSNSKVITLEGLALDSPSKAKEKILEEQYVLKSGMMWKRSEKGGWKQRWIVVRPSHICYFHSAVDKKPMGQIAIKAIKNITIERGLIGNTDFKNLKFCFAINTQKKKGALILGEKSIEDILEWIKMLDFAKAGGRPENAAEIFAKENEHTKGSHTSNDGTPRLNLLQGLSFSESLLDLARLTTDLDEDFLVSPHSGSANYLDSDTLSALLQPRNKSQDDNELDNSDSFPLSDTSFKDDDEDSNPSTYESVEMKIEDAIGELSPDEKKKKEKKKKVTKYITKKVEVVKPILKVKALYDYTGTDDRQLTFRVNDQWLLLEKKEEFGWWYGEHNGKYGLFPSNYVTLFEENVIDYQEVQVPVEEEEDEDDEDNSNNEENNNNSHNKNENNKIGENNKDIDNNSEKDGDKKEGEHPGKIGKSPSLTLSGSPSLGRKGKAKTMLSNFQLGEPLGKGAYGHVFRGINVDTGEMVAIKQVSLDNVNDQEVASIMAELELLKELDHVNIVQYKGFIQTSEHINLVLDYIEGGSLSSILTKFGPMHGVLIIRYIKQILEGLDYLHSKGVIHRDIKCSNILLTKNGTIKLSDFGLSSKLTELGEQEANGSPYWMAPEVIQLQSATTLSDIWSLGATIVELLTGKPPYYDLNKMQAMFSIVEEAMPPIPDDIPPELTDFLHKCFQKDLHNRPTAKDLLNHPLLQLDSFDHHNNNNHLLNNDNNNNENMNNVNDNLNDSKNNNNEKELKEDVKEVVKEEVKEETTVEVNGEVKEEIKVEESSAQPLVESFSPADKPAAETVEVAVQAADSNSSPCTPKTASDIICVSEIQILLTKFSASMDEKNIELTMSIRKSVRELLKKLKTIEKEGKLKADEKSTINQIYTLMIRCEDEMGEHIPVDSDVEFEDSDSDFEDDEGDDDLM